MYYILHLFIEAALAVLLVYAAFVIIVAIKRAITCPLRDAGVFTVIAARGSAEGLEHTVRAFRARTGTVVIADCGLSPDARKLAEIFAREGTAELYEPEEIPKLLEDCGWTGENTYA